MNDFDNQLTRIGVFYDGNYFLKVSNYYNYEHPRKARISIGGLHNFIRHRVAKEEGKNVRACHIVDTHYFRGRLNAYDAREQNKLYHDRIFDDILMNEGVITHYLPLRNRGGKREEKGIDVWLALEAYEMTIYKQFNVLVLIACDGDYVPLVRKLNTIGTRVMLLSWDFKYLDDKTGYTRETRTSQELIDSATFPVSMHEVIDNRAHRNDSHINNLFVNSASNGDNTTSSNSYSSSSSSTASSSSFQNFNSAGNYHSINSGYSPASSMPSTSEDENVDVRQSTLLSVKNGYGFVAAPPNNLFFSHEDLRNCDFSELCEGDTVEYTIGINDRGEYATNIHKIFPEGYTSAYSDNVQDDYENQENSSVFSEPYNDYDGESQL